MRSSPRFSTSREGRRLFIKLLPSPPMAGCNLESRLRAGATCGAPSRAGVGGMVHVLTTNLECLLPAGSSPRLRATLPPLTQGYPHCDADRGARRRALEVLAAERSSARVDSARPTIATRRAAPGALQP